MVWREGAKQVRGGWKLCYVFCEYNFLFMLNVVFGWLAYILW